MPRNHIPVWLPRTTAEPVPSCAFVACPMALQQAITDDQRDLQRRLYQWALEQAAAVIRPSILERFAANRMN